MKFVKNLVLICLSSLCLCSNIFAMRSSVSVPEGLSQYAQEDPKLPDMSLYSLNKLCTRIIVNSSTTHTEKIINDTAYVCSITFLKIKDLLYNPAVPADCFYVAELSNYIPIIEQINYILHDIVLSRGETTKLVFTPSPATKSNLDISIFAVASAMKRFEQIFWIELHTTFADPSRAQELHELMCDTWDGVWEISQLNSFRFN